MGNELEPLKFSALRGKHLTYDPKKQRHCVGCDPVKGQYPLRDVIETVKWITDDGEYVRLNCGHITYSYW